MNNPTQQLQQMARKLFKAKTGSSHVKILHPKRDWLIGMGIAFCIVVGITAWNGHTYFSNRDGGTTDIEIEVENPRYQAELVDQALNVYETRAADFEAVSGNVPSIPTPVAEPPTDTASTSTATSTKEAVVEQPPAEDESEESNPETDEEPVLEEEGVLELMQ